MLIVPLILLSILAELAVSYREAQLIKAETRELEQVETASRGDLQRAARSSELELTEVKTELQELRKRLPVRSYPGELQELRPHARKHNR